METKEASIPNKLPRDSKQKKKISINLKMTKYQIVKQVTLENFLWKSVTNDDWDIVWSDFYISEDYIRTLSPHQKVNHFPGSYLLCKKNFLASHLIKMWQILPKDYDFFPRTWILPFSYKNLQEYAESFNYKKVFIAKPEASCQGRGIFLTRKVFKSLNERENYVVQEYIENPYLIDGLKFDLRLYVLIKSVEPLKVFLYQDGLARFATDPFKKPKKKNFLNLFMHLTNYSINKKNPKFQQNFIENEVEFGHKRSFISIIKKLEEQGKDVKSLKKSIEGLILKTICSVQPYITHIYKANRPSEQNQEMCFEILGFDIIIDQNLKPWLLEVNHTPSFSADSDLDYKIKSNLISDTLKLVNVRKKKSKVKKNNEIIEYESKHLGGFTRIYPCEEQFIYENYMKSSKEIWNIWAQGKKRVSKNQEKEKNEQKLNLRPTKIQYKRPLSAFVKMEKPQISSKNLFNKLNDKTFLVPRSTKEIPLAEDEITKENTRNNENILGEDSIKNNRISSLKHTPFFCPQSKLFRPRSAVNPTLKLEEEKCEKQNENKKPSSMVNRDLLLLQDFLKPKNSGIVQEIYSHENMRIPDFKYKTKNAQFNHRNSHNCSEFDDKNFHKGNEDQRQMNSWSKSYLRPVFILNKQLLNTFLNKNLKK